jgi:hypothetical protein
MPESLINATYEFRKGIIDEATHAVRIEERWNSQMRPKRGPDSDGHIRMVCAAASPAPRVRCALKPKSEAGCRRIPMGRSDPHSHGLKDP